MDGPKSSARRRRAFSFGLQILAIAFVIAAIISLGLHNGLASWAITAFAASSAAGGCAACWLSRNRGAELEDAVSSTIGAVIFATLAPLAVFIVLYSALGGGR